MFSLLSYFSTSPVKKIMNELLSEKQSDHTEDSLDKLYQLSYE